MRQLVQDLRSGAVQVAELPDPKAGPGEVLVRTSWSLISPGTEQAVASTAAKGLVGKARDRPDQVRKVVDKAIKDGFGPTVGAVRARLEDALTPGYSSAGVVEAVGPDAHSVSVGDRVGCFGADVACHAERVAVPFPLCLSLPDELDPRFGAFAALGGIAGHGVRLAGIEAGSVVAVVGLGLVGQIAAQLVTAAGGRVIVIDPAADRVELACRLGAAGGAVLEEDDAEATVGSLSGGRGADAVIVAAATKDSGPIALAGALARDRAVVSVIGDVGLEVPRRPFFEKELELRVSRSYGPGRYDPAYEQEGRDYPIGYVRWTQRRLIGYFFEEVAAGRVRLGELVTHEFPIERAEEAYEALSDPSRLAILIRYGAPSEQEPTHRVAVSVPAPRRSGRARVALIGPGTFARSTLLPLLGKLDVEMAGVAGRSPARAAWTARKAGAGYAATDPEEVLSDDSVDVVVIATRHSSHAELAARALERGKAVFLEKPLAIDAAGLARLEELMTGDARLVVDFNRGFAPATLKARRHLTGRNDPLHVHYRVNAGTLESGHWLHDPKEGGGRLVGEGCHFVDLCAALVGHPLLSVRASRLDRTAAAADDSFLLELRYSDGSVATVSYVAAGDPRMEKERIEGFGGRRAVVIDDFRKVSLYGDGRRRSPAPLRRDKGHAALLAAAFEFFGRGGEPPIPYRRLVETTRATLVGREALSAGDEAPRSLAGALA
jgi:predicted dehydrogenase/threonine dehydrogenase-like Zn-dependent dehydrogenase